METDRFRAWLARKLMATSYATMRISDSRIDDIAKRLGIDPELLVEVRTQARIALHEHGLSRPASNRYAKEQNDRALYQLKIWLPPAVQEVWKAECARRGVHPPTLLRSLVHRYLLGAREPEPALTWTWDGELYKDYRKYKLDERATIPRGALQALTRRVAVRNTKVQPVVRALMLEAMQGEHMGIPLVTAGMMYDDETRYNLGDSART